MFLVEKEARHGLRQVRSLEGGLKYEPVKKLHNRA
jgi:hypothetical protein